MSGTHQYFTATGRALPRPPTHATRRSSSVLRLPIRRYDPVLDEAATSAERREGRRSFESPHGGEFVYKTEAERRRAQVVLYDPNRRYSTEGSNKVYGSLSTRVSRRNSQHMLPPSRTDGVNGPRAVERDDADANDGEEEEDVMTGATDLASSHSCRVAGPAGKRRPHQRNAARQERFSPVPHREMSSGVEGEDDSDGPSLDPHGIIDVHGSNDPDRTSVNRDRRQKRLAASSGSNTSVRELPTTATPNAKADAARNGTNVHGEATTGRPPFIALSPVDSHVDNQEKSDASRRRMGPPHPQTPPQPQPQNARRGPGRDDGGGASGSPSAVPTLGGPRQPAKRATPQQIRQDEPATPSAASTASLDVRRRPATKHQGPTGVGTPTAESRQEGDSDAPLPPRLDPRSRSWRSPAPATYQPFSEAALVRSLGGSAGPSGAAGEGAAPTPRYSRSPRKDRGDGDSPASLTQSNVYMESITEKVRRLSASPERSPQNGPRDEDGSGAPIAKYGVPIPASNVRGKRALSVEGTELLAAFPALQGQLDAVDNERDRSYRTIVKFIERQPEAQKRELKKLYLDDYTGKEAEFVELLSEAYGEDFEAMKAGAAVAPGADAVSSPLSAANIRESGGGGGGGATASRRLGFGHEADPNTAARTWDTAVEYDDDDEDGDAEEMGEGNSATYADPPEDKRAWGLADGRLEEPADTAGDEDEEGQPRGHTGQAGHNYGSEEDDVDVDDGAEVGLPTPAVPSDM